MNRFNLRANTAAFLIGLTGLLIVGGIGGFQHHDQEKQQAALAFQACSEFAKGMFRSEDYPELAKVTANFVTAKKQGQVIEVQITMAVDLSGSAIANGIPITCVTRKAPYDPSQWIVETVK